MTIIRVVDTVYRFLTILILIRVFMSWIRPQGYSPLYNKFARLVFQVTEPLLEPIRSILPNTGALDLSPMIAILLLNLMRNILWGVLF
jgi:YggT family protein